MRGITEDHSITVVFHAVIDVEGWQWHDEYSKAHIQFGHPELGDWKDNCGDGVPCVYVTSSH